MTTHRAHASAAISALVLGLTASPLAIAQSSTAALYGADIETERNITSEQGDMRANVRAFLERNGESLAAIEGIEVIREVEGSFGRRHMTYQQRVNGKRVFGAIVKASSQADGRLMTVSSRLAEPVPSFNETNIDAAEAVRIVVERNHGAEAPVPSVADRAGNYVTFTGNPYYWQAPSAEEVYIPDGNGQLELGWTITTWSDADNQLYETTINARGDIVDVMNRTANDDRYRVFPIQPDLTPQVTITGPVSGGTQSPDGWLWDGDPGEPTWTQYRRRIRGNNVYAYVDRINDSVPDNFSVVQADGHFTSNWTGSQDPTTQLNQNVAVHNLFYHNNLIHDILYDAGFTEQTGNFQEDNFGRGGGQSDSVNSEVQDGGGTNNANMATPSDGFNPRMQMYLTSSVGGVRRDTDYDSDVIIHEYGHGLTWRMINSMSGGQGGVAGAIGEGASDALAIIINDQDTVGEWSFAAFGPGGIRSQPYETYSRNMSGFTGSGVHFNGEIYAAAIWRVWQLYKQAGYSRDEMLRDWVQAMNFIAPRPDYLDMRDGFIDSTLDQNSNPTDRTCFVWEGFAERGMGEGAIFNWPTNVTNSFDIPSGCTGGGNDVLVTDLFGTSALERNGTRWRATVNVELDEPNTDVIVAWSRGPDRNCTTDSTGVCSVSGIALNPATVSDVTATITSVDGASPVADQGVPLSIVVTAPGSEPTGPVIESVQTNALDENGRRWRGQVTVGTGTANSVVEIEWSNGPNGTCTTDTSGVCTITSVARVPGRHPSIDYTIVSVDGEAPTAGPGVDLSGTILEPGSDPGPGDDPVVSDVTTESIDENGRRWRGRITIDVGAAGIPIEVDWSNGPNGTCTTGGSGTCTITSIARLYGTHPSIDVTIVAVDGGTPEVEPGVSLSATIDSPPAP
ncbi:MAG: M36 family metallopeptidase [Pseudomonadota bacterium]